MSAKDNNSILTPIAFFVGTVSLILFLSYLTYTKSIFWLLTIVPFAPVYWGLFAGAWDEIAKYRSQMGGFPIFSRCGKLYRTIKDLFLDSSDVIVEKERMSLKGNKHMIVLDQNYICLYTLKPIDSAKKKNKVKIEDSESEWVLKEETMLNAAETKDAIRLINKKKGAAPVSEFESAITSIREDNLITSMESGDNLLKQLAAFQQERQNKEHLTQVGRQEDNKKIECIASSMDLPNKTC